VLISYTIWLYFRFPLSLRMVEEMLAFRGTEVSHETIRQWGLKKRPVRHVARPQMREAFHIIWSGRLT
jgi:transposase-like protein